MTGSAAGSQPAKRRAAAKKPAAKTDPDLVEIRLGDMTSAEYEAVEELSGLPVARTLDVEQVQGSLNRAMAWVVRVRTDPDMLWEKEDCGRGVRPRCGDCVCSRRLKHVFRFAAAPVPPSGEND